MSKKYIVHFEETGISKPRPHEEAVAKFSDAQGVSRTKEFFRKEHSRIKRLKIVLKSKDVIDIK